MSDEAVNRVNSEHRASSVGELIEQFGADVYNEAARISRDHPPAGDPDFDAPTAFEVEISVHGSNSVTVMARSEDEAVDAVNDDAARFLDPEYDIRAYPTSAKAHYRVDEKRGLVWGSADEDEKAEVARAEAARTAPAIARVAGLIQEHMDEWDGLPAAQRLTRAVMATARVLEVGCQ